VHKHECPDETKDGAEQAEERRELGDSGEQIQFFLEAGHLGQACFFQRFADAFAPVVAIEDGGFDEASDGAGRGIADGKGLDDIIAFEDVADAVEELGRINLGAMAVKKSFDKNDDSNGAGEKDDPEDRTAVVYKKPQRNHLFFIRFMSVSSKGKVRRCVFGAASVPASRVMELRRLGGDTRPTEFRLASGAGWRILLVVASSLRIPGANPAVELMNGNSFARLAGTAARVPTRWRKEVERILITDDVIARRIRQMSRDIERDFRGREMVVVSLLNGTVMFLADLIRNLSLPLRLDFIGVSSYGAGTESGELVFTKELRLDVCGRDVLLVDDILDTGKTLYRVLEKLEALKPRRIKTCVLLNKAARRVEKVEADYVGFEIPDFFVVGYGLDFAERYRNLPFVGVLHPDVYKQGQETVAGRHKRTGGR